MIKAFNYTDFCVLTDVSLMVTAEGGWHPSYINVFNPETKRTMTMHYRQIEDCVSQTNLTLTLNKQGIICFGRKVNSCGGHNLPEQDRISPPLFLKNFRFDPQGPENKVCKGLEDMNYYSFVGSYYYVYMKMAQCMVPQGESYHIYIV